MNAQFGAGAFLTTETEKIDLGEHYGIRLEGRVQRRMLRLGLGGERGFRLEIARSRATSISASSGTPVQVHRLAANPDPWIEATQRLVVVAIVSTLLPWMVRRIFARTAAE